MKNVIIVEGADACGKSQLCEHLKNKVNGKCHIIHSNYDKAQPKSNHLRQHFLITKFVAKQFSERYYTGNNLVILDRNYISDIVYGQIGYGSFGSLSFKCRILTRLLKMLNKNANVTIIYCNPEKSAFQQCCNSREELLNADENTVVRYFYNKFFTSNINKVLRKCDSTENVTYKLYYKNYSYITDPEYKKLDEFLSIIM